VLFADFAVGRNFAEVFGENATWFKWFLPSHAPPLGNGIVYPMDFNDGRAIRNDYASKKKDAEEMELP